MHLDCGFEYENVKFFAVSILFGFNETFQKNTP